MRRFFAGATAASLMLALMAASASAAPAVNGSFEAGSAPGSFTQVSAVDSTTITGWTVSSGTVDYIGTYWPAADGARSIDLNGSGPGAIQQSVATTIGATYRVTFSMSGNPVGGAGTKTLTAGIGAAPASFSYEIPALNPPTLTDMKWATRTFTFVATAATTTLTFTSTVASSAFGPALDNVRVNNVRVDGAGAKPWDVCKNGAWRQMHDRQNHQFKNQGDCVSYFATKFRNGGAIGP
ncbi:MAG: choice-of-anchor C family protein [Chloroflexota bacterium]